MLKRAYEKCGLCAEPVTKTDEVIFRRHRYPHTFANGDSIAVEDLLEDAFAYSSEGVFTRMITNHVSP